MKILDCRDPSIPWDERPRVVNVPPLTRLPCVAYDVVLDPSHHGRFVVYPETEHPGTLDRVSGGDIVKMQATTPDEFWRNETSAWRGCYLMPEKWEPVVERS